MVLGIKTDFPNERKITFINLYLVQMHPMVGNSYSCHSIQSLQVAQMTMQ